MTPSTIIPSAVTAGTTVTFIRVHSEYPPSAGWTAKLHIRGASALDVTAEADGEAYHYTLTAAQTAALRAGTYTWAERLYRSEEVHQVDSGRIQVDPDVAAAGEGDLQSWAEKTLAIVQAGIDKRLTKDQEGYTIEGIMISRMPAETLLRLRAQLETRINIERTGRIGQPISVRFNDPRACW